MFVLVDLFSFFCLNIFVLFSHGFADILRSLVDCMLISFGNSYLFCCLWFCGYLVTFG